MNFLSKNKAIIAVIALSIWINFFPSTDPSRKEGQRSFLYAISNTNSHLYPHARYIIPLLGLAAIFVSRSRRKDDK
ncbi:hypothetical protein GCM10023338_14680 [Wohlfahrtiimonas larvae]|uniref:Uncharacterized protein n=1 Tax=Wohlfahrtiimonas larvae TaxID=1157986 RepID=A0ABP9MV57_9GAMM